MWHCVVWWHVYPEEGVNFCQAPQRGQQKTVIFMFICILLNFAVSISKLGPLESNGRNFTEYRKKEIWKQMAVKETMQYLSHDNVCPYRCSNRTHPKHKLEGWTNLLCECSFLELQVSFIEENCIGAMSPCSLVRKAYECFGRIC